MVGTGRQYREIINRAAEETKLARTKVEVSLVEMYFTVKVGNKMYQQDEILRRNTPKFNVRNIWGISKTEEHVFLRNFTDTITYQLRNEK